MSEACTRPFSHQHLIRASPEVDFSGVSVPAWTSRWLCPNKYARLPPSEPWIDFCGGAEWGWTGFVMVVKSVLESAKGLRSARDG